MILSYLQWFGVAVASFVAWTKFCSTLGPVSTGIGDRLRAGIPTRYVYKPTRSTQPCIPPGSLNRVPALISWDKGGNVSYAGWQITLCDPIWHVSFRIAVRHLQTAIPSYFTLLYFIREIVDKRLRLRWRTLAKSAKRCSCLASNWYRRLANSSRHNVVLDSAPLAPRCENMTSSIKPRKSITYRNAVRGGLSYGHRQRA